MVGAMLESSGVRIRIVTAGTHVLENQPMSIRTRAALESVGLPVPFHRSHQVTEDDLAGADLVLAMAAEHVWYVRRRHPRAAPYTATIRFLEEHLVAGSESLRARVEALGLEHVDPADQGDVADPAGGTDADYFSCAQQLDRIVTSLAPRLAGNNLGAG